MANAIAGSITTSNFRVAGSFGASDTYKPLEIVFRFNKYREVKPFVPALDSFDFDGTSYKSPSPPTYDVADVKYVIKLYYNIDHYTIRGT